jgi:hypothetical protein
MKGTLKTGKNGQHDLSRTKRKARAA